MSDKQYRRMSREMQVFFEETVEEADRISGFSQRDSPLDAAIFAKTLILGWLGDPDASLEDLAMWSEELGAAVSHQAIDQRMNERGVMFMACLLQLSLQHLQTTVQHDIDVLKHFNAVRIIDSTQVPLPQHMWDDFRGHRQDVSMLKIHLCFEYLSGNLMGVELTEGRHSDQKSALLTVCAGDLLLQDLGFFNQMRLKQVHEQGAYFVSRLQSQTGVYDPASGERIVLDEVTEELTGDWAEFEWKIGRLAHLPVRVIFARVPADKAQERRRKVKRQARRHKKNCTKAYLARQDWNILITNISQDWLSTDQIWILYRLRWQIELLFKLWKSHLNLAAFHQWRPHRVMCQLYARLIAAILFQWMMAPWRFSSDTMLSLSKALPVLRLHLPRFVDAIADNWRGMARRLKRCFQAILRHASQGKRNKSPSTYQLLCSIKS